MELDSNIRWSDWSHLHARDRNALEAGLPFHECLEGWVDENLVTQDRSRDPFLQLEQLCFSNEDHLYLYVTHYHERLYCMPAHRVVKSHPHPPLPERGRVMVWAPCLPHILSQCRPERLVVLDGDGTVSGWQTLDQLTRHIPSRVALNPRDSWNARVAREVFLQPPKKDGESSPHHQRAPRQAAFVSPPSRLAHQRAARARPRSH